MVALGFALGGCASVISNAGAGLAGSISSAMVNQNDPEIVRDGAPAFMMMLDGLVEQAPDDPALLSAAAELYASYGAVFVDEPDRARKLTTRARDYGRRALCAAEAAACGIWDKPFEAYVETLDEFGSADVSVMYAFALSWMAYIRAHSDDWGALARLPEVRQTLVQIHKLDPGYREAKLEQYLAVLNTIRPPALGGDFEVGQAHFEKALSLAGDKDLSIKVDYARYYARTLYDRELHDRLLNEVMEADPEQAGFVLTNIMSQEDALALLETADDYF